MSILDMLSIFLFFTIQKYLSKMFIVDTLSSLF